MTDDNRLITPEIVEDELKAYAIAIINSIKQLLALSPLYSEQVRQFLSMFGPDKPDIKNFQRTSKKVLPSILPVNRVSETRG